MAGESDGLLWTLEDFDLVVMEVAVNSQYIVACTPSLSARLFNWSGKHVHTFQHSSKARTVAMSSKHVVFGQKRGMLELWDLKRRSVSHKIEVPDKLFSLKCVCISDSHIFACPGKSSHHEGPVLEKDIKRLSVAYLCSIPSGDLTHTISHGKEICKYGIALSDMHAVTSGDDRIVKLWLVESGELLWTVPAAGEYPSSVALSCEQLLLTGKDNVLALGLSNASVQQEFSFPDGGDCGSWAKLATDGRSLVLSNSERHATVWTIADGRKMCSTDERSSRRHDFGAAICADHWVLRVGKTIRVYDLAVHAGYRRAASESLGVKDRKSVV